jgi:Mrp family chromosome partitioning ATPase
VGNNANEQYALLTDYDANTAYSEAFHTLFANIRLSWDTEQTEPHSLLLTTPSTYSEQATAAANLGIVAAQSGIPTLLVDADLRNPGLSQRFGLGKTAGLSDLLKEDSVPPQKLASYLQTTFVPHLRLLGAGNSTSEAATLLLSPNLREVVESIRQYLEETETTPGIILFHSPAVLEGAGTSLLAALVDQTFLTIIKDHTTRAQAKQAQEQLQRAHANLAGIILLNA